MIVETLRANAQRLPRGGPRGTDDDKPKWREKMTRKYIEMAQFSVEKANEGGRFSFKEAKELLESNGIKPVRRGYSPYVGHYGLEVPKEFEDQTSDLLFG